MDLKRLYREKALQHGYNEVFVKRVMKEADLILQNKEFRKTYFFTMLAALRKAHDKVVAEWDGMILEGMVIM